jgi:transcription termination factor Rho
MAQEPTNKTVLETKEREELVQIASAIGVKTSARASKATLISAIMDSAPETAPTNGERAARPGPIRSRRTVATPETDFDDFVKEVTASEPHSETSAAASESSAPSSESIDGDNSATSAPSRNSSPRTERAPREYNSGPGNSNANGASSSNSSSASNDRNAQNNRRNRRNRGRDRFDRGEPQSGADQPYNGELVEVKGLLDLRDDGYGFLRTNGYQPSANDVYVSISQVRRYHLRKGDAIEGAFRPAASNEKYAALLRVDTIHSMDPELARQRPRFEDLTPLFPDEKLRLETNEGKNDLTPRIVDLISPIGKGQRGLIVSPPKAGKTTVMKQIAQSIEVNNPDVHLIVLLVDERPEEVTDMRRSVRGEVVASTFDRPADEHTHLAELTIERAKRLVELGRDVVIILDGITRLARAYNLAQPATGRIMSGGVDSGALYPPKRFFGAARNIEEGGSLTILATALVETGSKMDEVIFEEFKGTGNMELKLDRRLAERRLYPAIDVNGSSTRHEELLFDRDQLTQVWKLRRVLNGLSAEGRDAAGLELLLDKLRQTRSNDEFLAEIGKGPSPTS